MEGMGRPHRFAVGDTDEVITDDSPHKVGAQHAAPLKSFQPFGASRLRGKKFFSNAAHHMSKRLLTVVVIVLVFRQADWGHGAEARKVTFSIPL